MKNSQDESDVYVKMINQFLRPDLHVINRCSVFFVDLSAILLLSQIRNMDVPNG